MKAIDMARTFHRTFDPQMQPVPTAFDQEQALNRAKFKLEEIVEFVAASRTDDSDFESQIQALHEALDQARQKVLSKQQKTDPLVDQVDALTDLLYFTYGSFALMGVDPDPMMEIVHQANMGKIFPDGKPHYQPATHKVLKPANWEKDFAPEAKIKAELLRQSNL